MKERARLALAVTAVGFIFAQIAVAIALAFGIVSPKQVDGPMIYVCIATMALLLIYAFTDIGIP